MNEEVSLRRSHEEYARDVEQRDQVMNSWQKWHNRAKKQNQTKATMCKSRDYCPWEVPGDSSQSFWNWSKVVWWADFGHLFPNSLKSFMEGSNRYRWSWDKLLILYNMWLFTQGQPLILLGLAKYHLGFVPEPTMAFLKRIGHNMSRDIPLRLFTHEKYVAFWACLLRPCLYGDVNR